MRKGLDCDYDECNFMSLYFIQGKPTKLESQFRLTYSMILNLLRVEQLRVEDMIKRSFSEFHSQKDKVKHKEDMENLYKEISNVKDIECYMCSIDLEEYYQTCKDYHELKKKLQVTFNKIGFKTKCSGKKMYFIKMCTLKNNSWKP